MIPMSPAHIAACRVRDLNMIDARDKKRPGTKPGQSNREVEYSNRVAVFGSDLRVLAPPIKSDLTNR